MLVPYHNSSQRTSLYWPNIQSAMTVASIVSSIFLMMKPVLKVLSVCFLVRSISLIHAVYRKDYFRVFSGITALAIIILALHGGAVVAPSFLIATATGVDIISEWVNFDESVLKKRFYTKEGILDLYNNTFVDVNGELELRPRKPDPDMSIEFACKVLGISEDKARDLNFVQERYKEMRENLLQKKAKTSAPLALAVQRMIDKTEAAYTYLCKASSERT